METKDECPFKPGAPVLVDDGYGNYQAATVRKVYKTGKFVLWDDPENRQWRLSDSRFKNSKDPMYGLEFYILQQKSRQRHDNPNRGSQSRPQSSNNGTQRQSQI